MMVLDHHMRMTNDGFTHFSKLYPKCCSHDIFSSWIPEILNQEISTKAKG